MQRNIPLFIECIAFVCLIVCLILYNTNTIFLSIIITFVTFEIMMEAFQIRLKRHISHIYTALFITSGLITNLLANGLHLTSIFPVFFMAVLLIVSQYIYVPEYRKEQHYNVAKEG
ncbi:hypothetical protein [Bacillus manliponensis]|uniref:hypothetical protein n=1 Tax=Bacillus manliponensis TaxID=574376 RepID=UPI003516F562